ncbi:MAG: hypothetical protein C0424_05795 [Sphingobacteriaceae bacterium]|nr:hypothetical protein [Sphingobacteriaceae bacterium]
MRTYFLFILLAFCLAGSRSATATHVLGAELSYSCQGNGLYRFTLVVYRDCLGIDLPPNSISISSPVSFSLPLVSVQDISPRCSGSSLISCTPDANGNILGGAVSKSIYSTLLNLSGWGAPPLSGYRFSVTLPCCRPALSNSAITEMSVTATMHRFVDPTTNQALTPAQLCDNSPVFTTNPAVAYILNPADTVYAQHFASDVDGDQVLHQLTLPRDNFRSDRPYLLPYTLSAPLPGMLGSMGVGAANHPIHPQTGEIVFRPAMPGNFVTCVRASAFRNGQLISEVTRDFAVKIVTAYVGSPLPYTTQGLASFFSQRAPQIWKPQTQGDSTVQSFVRSFYAGDSIKLLLQSEDVFPTLSGDPINTTTWGPPNQQLKFAVLSQKLSESNDASVGCDLPPCATLNRLPITLPSVQPSLQFLGNGLPLGRGFSTLNYNGMELIWLPDCGQVRQHDHAAGAATQSSYGFVLRAADAMCVLEGATDRALLINILSKPILQAPAHAGLQFDNANQHFQLSWTPLIDTLTIDSLDLVNWGQQLSLVELRQKSVHRRMSSFHAYRIYRQLNYGPWHLVGERHSIYDSLFTDTSAFPQAHAVSYQIRTVSGCNLLERASNRMDYSVQNTAVFEAGKSAFMLSPNPGQGWYQIRLIDQKSLPEKLELRDLQGRLLHEWSVSEREIFGFELHNLPAGVYFLQSAHGNLRLKLVHRP